MRCVYHICYGICLSELSNMPIADLLQLKERLGAKMYVFYLLCGWWTFKSNLLLKTFSYCHYVKLSL